MFKVTVSLIYEICHWIDRREFYFSSYPKNSKFYDESNKAVIGKMKNEDKGEQMVEFVGTKSKMCPYIREDDTGDKNANRIKNMQLIMQ